MKSTTPNEQSQSDITFSDCLESVRYEIEDALERFPANKDLFLHQIRLLLETLSKGAEITELDKTRLPGSV
jgi:hypothetical protein